jgi:hypothetical protein
MNFVSQLTLEVYIVQGVIISMVGSKLNGIFPLNIVAAFSIIFIIAYATNIMGKIFLQTFRENPYNWRSILIIRKG